MTETVPGQLRRDRQHPAGRDAEERPELQRYIRCIIGTEGRGERSWRAPPGRIDAARVSPPTSLPSPLSADNVHYVKLKRGERSWRAPPGRIDAARRSP